MKANKQTKHCSTIQEIQQREDTARAVHYGKQHGLKGLFGDTLGKAAKVSAIILLSAAVHTDNTFRGKKHQD